MITKNQMIKYLPSLNETTNVITVLMYIISFFLRRYEATLVFINILLIIIGINIIGSVILTWAYHKLLPEEFTKLRFWLFIRIIANLGFLFLVVSRYN